MQAGAVLAAAECARALIIVRSQGLLRYFTGSGSRMHSATPCQKAVRPPEHDQATLPMLGAGTKE
jgi:hypothetical protein